MLIAVGTMEATNALNAKTIAKRCPFCGKKPFVNKGKRHGKDSEPNGILSYKAGEWVWKPSLGCKPCGIEREADLILDALKWWNNRA